MCLDFDQSLSDGNHATPFGSFIWGSGNRVKKAKGPLRLIASFVC
jgi:hypothetical protein